MAMNRKRLLIDVLGYSALVPFFMFYFHLERAYPGYVAVILTVVAFLPVAAVWHHYYGKFTENE